MVGAMSDAPNVESDPTSLLSVDKHRRGQPQLGIGQIIESDPTFPLVESDPTFPTSTFPVAGGVEGARGRDRVGCADCQV